MKKMLQKILAFVPQRDNTVNNFSLTNAIVTAWAMEKSGTKEEGKNYLLQKLQKDPDNKILKWSMDVYSGKPASLPADVDGALNFRVLSAWLSTQK